jgi:hypothetical protein
MISPFLTPADNAAFNIEFLKLITRQASFVITAIKQKSTHAKIFCVLLTYLKKAQSADY